MVMLAPESLVIRLMAALTRARVDGCTAWGYVTLEQLTAGSERAWSSSRRLSRECAGRGGRGWRRLIILIITLIILIIIVTAVRQKAREV